MFAFRAALGLESALSGLESALSGLKSAFSGLKPVLSGLCRFKAWEGWFQDCEGRFQAWEGRFQAWEGLGGLTDGQTNKWMDRWMDEQKSPCVLQDFVPFGAAALLPLILIYNHAKQGNGYRWPHIGLGRPVFFAIVIGERNAKSGFFSIVAMTRRTDPSSSRIRHLGFSYWQKRWWTAWSAAQIRSDEAIGASRTGSNNIEQ